MKKLLTIALFALLLTVLACTDKDNPQPCIKRKEVYDRGELPKVRRIGGN